MINNSYTPYYCPNSKIDVIVSIDKIVDEKNGWLIVGWPGFDGIEFKIKKDSEEATVYAFYPIHNEHVPIAHSTKDLIERWKEGVLEF